MRSAILSFAASALLLTSYATNRHVPGDAFTEVTSPEPHERDASNRQIGRRGVEDPPDLPRRIARADSQPGDDYAYPDRLRPTPHDQDADGIPDADERRLLDKFAPVFKYDARETHFPVAVDDYVPQVSLWFRHRDLRWGCPHHLVLEQGRVNLSTLVRQVHPAGCDHNRGNAASNAPIQGGEFFYLSLVTCIRWSTECQREAREACAGSADPRCEVRVQAECQREFLRRQREAIRRGETIGPGVICEDVGILRGYKDLNRLRAYAAVRPATRKLDPRLYYEIYVTVFYPVSALEGSFLGLVGPFGEHVADWEKVSIYVTPAGELVGVTYYAHKDKSFVPARRVERDTDGVRPVVYVGAQSHASYPRAGKTDRGAGPFGVVPLPADWHRGNNEFSFPTRGRVINVGRTEFPAAGSGWIEYRGPWGQDWDPNSIPVIGDLEGASPKTPKF